VPELNTNVGQANTHAMQVKVNVPQAGTHAARTNTNVSQASTHLPQVNTCAMQVSINMHRDDTNPATVAAVCDRRAVVRTKALRMPVNNLVNDTGRPSLGQG